MNKNLALIPLFVVLVLASISCKANGTISSEITPTSTTTTPVTTAAAQTPTIIETSTTSMTITTTTTTVPTIQTTTPTTTQTTTTTALSCLARNGDWKSNEKSEGIISGAILTFTVDNCHITSLTVSVFPVPNEWFLWWLEESKGSLDIQGNQFSYSLTSGGGEFILEGEFTSDNTCKGTMKFTKGFFWVDFTVPSDVTFTWNAQPST
jgi:hypothetical protein